MRMRKATLLALAALGIMGATTPAMAIRLDPTFWVVDPAPVYVLIYRDSDWLCGRGDTWVYRGTFEGLTTYKFVLVVPPGADFDIKIYDENGNLVASGTANGSTDEVVYLTPLWTGPFRIEVYSYSGCGFYTLKVYKQL